MIFTARPSQRTRRSVPLLRVGACVVLAGTTPALAQQRAGTQIVNIAVVEADMDSGRARVASNNAAVQVDEVLGIGLQASATAIAAEGAASAAPFVLTNTGNGEERFTLAATLEGVSSTVRGFAVDTNGNGVFDSGDVLLQGSFTPVLAPGQSLRLLALLDPIGTVLPTAALSVFARAVTGSGAPGTLYRGRGDEGSDAIVGPTTAEATIRFSLAPGAAPEAALVKSQSLWSPGATMAMMRGAIITYSLAASFNGGGTARGASVVDPIPAGTAFLPGSIMLDGVALSDASDGDAGTFDGTRVAVALGDVAAPQTRTVQFKVTIQ